MKTLDVRRRATWRQWLATHHSSATEVWLVFHKRHTGIASVPYEDAVEEALCFGWVDSLIKRLDEDRYARKFTPRKADSRWSTSNRRRYAKLQAAGLVAAAGLGRHPTSRSGDAPRVSTAVVPAYIVKALKARPAAWKIFQALAPSHRRRYIGWIDSAKQEETRQRRLNEARRLLLDGQHLGLR